MLGLVDIVTLIVLLTFLRFSLVAPGHSFSISRSGILCHPSLQINFDFQLQLRRFALSTFLLNQRRATHVVAGFSPRPASRHCVPLAKPERGLKPATPSKTCEGTL